MADRGDRPRPGHGVARAGRPRQAAVLARRRARSADRARAGARRVRRARSRTTSTRGARGRKAATDRLRDDHDLDELAAENLVAYLEDEREVVGALPTDRRIVVERFRDELGDWRLVLLTPFGGRVHAPWSLALESRIGEKLGAEVQTIWSDDGIAIRLPDSEVALEGVGPAAVPGPRGGRGPRRLAGRRRRRCSRRASARTRRGRCSCRAAGPGRGRRSGSSASGPPICWRSPRRYGSFPILVETYREVLSDVFDLPALRDVLGGVASREITVHGVETAAGVAIRELAAVRLRRRLHVRRRRAAGRAPGRRADARPRPPPRAARPGGAARAARPGRARRPRAEPPGADR